jgi:hypothetical protein
VELFAGHGGAVNAVAARFGAYVYDRVAGAAGLAVKDLVLLDHAQGEGVHQRVAAVAGFELGFAAQVGNAKAVAVAGNAAHHALDDGSDCWLPVPAPRCPAQADRSAANPSRPAAARPW